MAIMKLRARRVRRSGLRVIFVVVSCLVGLEYGLPLVLVVGFVAGVSWVVVKKEANDGAARMCSNGRRG
jgi:hypothetical protein